MGLKKLIAILLLLGGAFYYSSCGLLNQNIMLRTKKDYVFDMPPDTVDPEYRISPNDMLDFRLFSKDGFKLVDLSSQAQQGGGNFNQSFARYLVEHDGLVKLPILGRIQIAGYTLRDAEYMLVERYRSYYNDPFILLNVQNRRVIVFPGDDASASVISLVNNNTTLIEALAMAGGLSSNGKAKKIKLIRRTELNQDPEVFLIDLSQIAGVKQANMIVQANDIIYVQPRLRLASDVIKEITPIVSLISSTFTIITFYNFIQSQP